MSSRTHAPSPATDGVDHVNVYSRAKTEEGKLLSNFAHTPFTLHGHDFASVEGFYQSMRCDEERDRAAVAATFGREAKAWGKKSGKRPGDPIRTWDGRTVAFKGEAFLEEVKKAVREKLRQCPGARRALTATENLPLTHYYVMWGRPTLPPGGPDVLTSHLTELRAAGRDAEAVRAVLGPWADRAVPELVAALGDGEDGARYEAARALAFHPGPDVRAAVPALVAALDGPDEALRRRALRTLVQIDLGPEEAEQVFGAGLASASEVVRMVATARLVRPAVSAL